jgi:sulfate adenylyltransferase subunit 2
MLDDVNLPHTHESHIHQLEAEAIHVIREVAAERERPVLLFSGGKDSLVLLHLTRKAFYPATVPFPIMHVDTGHNFPEVLDFRDQLIERIGARLVVARVQDSIDEGRVHEEPGMSRNQLQTVTLKDTIKREGIDAAFGGARRDEEKSRAKERFVSLRDRFGQWEPRNQRPELWDLYNTQLAPGENLRVYPLSNWTELDVWLYVNREQLDVPSIYFAHSRQVFERDGILYAVNPYLPMRSDEHPYEDRVRFRTVGDMTCTGAVRSEAQTLQDILAEVVSARITERGAGRADDRVSAAAMEERKREGYF